MVQNKQLIFAEPPKGLPEPGKTTKVITSEIDLDNVKLDGGIVVKQLCLSLDPYMRGRMRPAEIKSYTPAFTINEPLTNFAVSKVVRSEHADYKKGDTVYCMSQFAEYAVIKDVKAAGVRNLEELRKQYPNIPVESFIGGCGMPGKTASWAFKYIGKPKKGETVFVSSAAGAVGSLVVQLAKNEGCYVIGSAGSDDKVAYLKEIGADHAFNYKTNKIDDELKKLGRGIDINWENVGADTLDTLLTHMNTHGRIIVCGLAGTYNGEQYAYKNVAQVLIKSLHMEGFIILHHPDFDKEFYETIPPLVSAGKLNLKEDITEGLENAEEAFVNLLTGKNKGKAVIRVSKE